MTEGERRHFEVLLEDIHRSVTIIAEGHGDLVRRMDSMDGKLDQRFDALDEKIGWVAEVARDGQNASEHRDMKLETRIQTLERKAA